MLFHFQVIIKLIYIIQETFTKMFKKRVKKDQKVIHLNDSANENSQQQNVGSQPRKMIKIDLPKQKGKSIPSASSKKQELKGQNKQQHIASINYKASNTLKNQQKVELVQQGVPYEQVQAKEKFMSNLNMTKLIRQGKLSTNVYRGTNAYADYTLTPNDIQNAQQSYKKRHGTGPSRAGNNTRNTCRFDYDKALCKDWHDAGYCVFGNSCIYLHDRSNYKTGWELEKQYEDNERLRWKRINNPDYRQKPAYLEEAEKHKVDDTCKLCQSTFKSPVQVQCGHVFCMKCAMQLNQSPGKCCVCSKKLGGIMNNAEKKLTKQKQMYEQMVNKLQKEDQENKGQRSKYRDLNSLDVFTNQ